MIQDMQLWEKFAAIRSSDWINLYFWMTLSDIGHWADPTSEQNSLTLPYVLKLICPSLTFNLVLLFSESSVHNSWSFNDIIWKLPTTWLHMYVSKQVTWKQSNSLFWLLNMWKILNVEVQNIKNSKIRLLTCRMYVWDRFKSFDGNILKIALKRQVICAAAAEYLCKKDKFWSEKCYLLQ